MGIILARILQTVIDIYIFIIFLSAILSYFLPPYHRVREFVDRFVNPVLIPIRRVIPPIGMVDISPIVLLLIVQLGGSMLVNILYRLP